MADTPSILFSRDADRAELSRAAAEGKLLRLARGIYTSDVLLTPEAAVRRHVWPIVGHAFPGAVITDLSVDDGGTGRYGAVFVVAWRTRPLELPGLTIVPRSGAGPVDGDTALPHGIWLAGNARALLDNLVPSRARSRSTGRTAGRAWVERRVDLLCARSGSEALNQLRDDARAIAPSLDRVDQFDQLDAIIGRALATRPSDDATTPELRSRALGLPVDQTRLPLLFNLCEALRATAPTVVTTLPVDDERRALLPFYEAYFSNYIEGTEFTLDEAAGIVFDDDVPTGRRP